jgi:hypothetical protein
MVACRRYANSYGSLRREVNPTCQADCAAGYYCQHSSISPYANPCGLLWGAIVNGSRHIGQLHRRPPTR